MPLLHQFIAVGIVISIIFSEIFSISAAGLVVPGYLAYYIDRPLFLLMIFFAATVTWSLEKLSSKVVFLYGRRLLAMDVLLSFVTIAIISLLIPDLGKSLDPLAYFIPAIIVIFIGANGVKQTAIALLLNTVIVKTFMLIVKFIY